MERIHKFFQLPSSERILLVQAWALFLLAELALQLLSFKRLLTLCNNIGRKRREQPRVAVPSVPRLAWLVEVASRYTPVTVTCLKQTLVLSWLLRSRGLATTLRIGVARCEDAFTAHAWLEHNGQVIPGLPGSAGYQPLFPVRC